MNLQQCGLKHLTREEIALEKKNLTRKLECTAETQFTSQRGHSENVAFLSEEAPVPITMEQCTRRLVIEKCPMKWGETEIGMSLKGRWTSWSSNRAPRKQPRAGRESVVRDPSPQGNSTSDAFHCLEIGKESGAGGLLVILWTWNETWSEIKLYSSDRTHVQKYLGDQFCWKSGECIIKSSRTRKTEGILRATEFKTRHVLWAFSFKNISTHRTVLHFKLFQILQENWRDQIVTVALSASPNTRFLNRWCKFQKVFCFANILEVSIVH